MAREDAKLDWIELIGKARVDSISGRMTDFDRLPIDIYKENIIEINLLEQDGKGDIVGHCQINYNEDTKKFSSENGIDDEPVLFDSYEEMKDHLHSLNEERIKYNFPYVNLPK